MALLIQTENSGKSEVKRNIQSPLLNNYFRETEAVLV